MNKMPVTVLQRLLHVLVTSFTIRDSNLLAILKFSRNTSKFESMAIHQKPTLKNSHILNAVQFDDCTYNIH